jgi:tellurite resistance protein
MSLNGNTVIAMLQDELLVLVYIARSDKRMNDVEREVIVRYAKERSRDNHIFFDDGIGAEVMSWVAKQTPSKEAIAPLITRLCKNDKAGAKALLEVTTIVAEMDGQVKASEQGELAVIQTLLKAHME